MTTLESIRKRKALLGKSKEEYDAFREKWENVYYELGKKLQPDANGFDDYGYWRLIEAVGHKNPKEFIKKQYGIEVSDEDMAQLNELLNAIRTECPARYFETKFERPLQLRDFTAAVVPNDIPLDVESRLKDAGVEVIEYEKGDNASRAEAMQKASAMEGVRFSLQTINELNDALTEYNTTSDIASFVDAVREANDKFGKHPYLTNLILDYEEDGDADVFAEKIKGVIGEANEDYAPYTAGGVRYSLSEEQASSIIEAMKTNAEVAPQLELTPENWVAEFGENGVVSTPIGEVKMSDNQYQKMQQQGRNTKFGMIKPTLTNPDVIIEEESKPKNGREAERNSSFVFVKAFTNAEGTRDYMFTSVSNLRDGIEIVMSNQEKETPRVKRLLKEGKLAYINKATLPSEFTASAQGDQSTLPSEVSYSESKDTTSSIKKQANEQKFSLITPEMDADYLSAVERGDMATAQQMVMEAAKLAGYVSPTDYQGSLAFNGAAPMVNDYFETKEERKEAWDNGDYEGTMSLGDYADNAIDTNDLEWQLTDKGNYRRATDFAKESIDSINESIKNGNHKITIYRAVPTEVEEGAVRNGDWVTLSRKYAEYHIGLQDWEGGRVIEQEVDIDNIWWNGDDINEWGYDDGSNYGYRNTPNNRKLLDPVTYDDNGNVIPLSERFNPEKEDIRYSIQAPTFYSNAEYAVLNIKQEKATPEQWLKMIEKAGGLKAGEDKWLGLSDWLKASDKKTLSKDEVLQYIADNNFVIEEVEYADVADISREEIYESAEFETLRESLMEYDDEDNPHINRERYDELRSESPDFVDGFSLDYWGEELEIDSPAAAATYLGLTKADKEINSTRLEYTTAGLENKREIALVVPSIEPYNRHDEIHFGDAGEGRAVAWIRFGETEAPKNVPMYQRADAFDAPFKNVAGYDVYVPEGNGGKFAKDYVIYGKLKDGSEAYIVYINSKAISKHDTLEDARNAMNEYYEANPRMVTRYERVLVIDEIQSKRHQDAREKGYRDEAEIVRVEEAENALRELRQEFSTYRDNLKEKYDYNSIEGGPVTRAQAFMKMMTEEERARFTDLATKVREAENMLQAAREPQLRMEDIAFTEEDGTIVGRYGDLESRFVTGTSREAVRQDLQSQMRQQRINDVTKRVPSAPFEKNWAELAMKRMLRYAAENGFDKVAWTTGEQQAERYNIGNVVSRVLSYPFEGNTKVVINLQNDSPLKMTVNSEGVVEKSNNGTEGQSLADVVGKELANKIMNGEGEPATVYDGGDIEAKEISGDGLRIGGEGMKAFYDQMLPSFMNKYGKKWGVKVGEVTMPALEENNTMHSVDVTDAMRESVMQGQPRFSLHDVEAQRFNRKVEFIKGLVKEYNIPNPLFIAETKEEFVQMVKDYDGEVDEFTPDTYGYYCPDDDIILLNGGMLITSGDAHRSTMHEYAHSITKKYLGEKLAEITTSILETEIDKARKEMLPEAYNECSYPEIIDEFTSLLLEDLTIAETHAIFEGEMAIDTFVEKLKKDINAIEKLSNKDVLYAVIPLVVENLKIQKEQYGKDREHTIVIPRVDSRRNSTFSQTSHLSGDKKSRPSEAESRVYEAGRGGEGSQKEVDAHYSIQAPEGAEEAYKAALLEEAMRMEREATSSGVDLAQEIADTTGWVHLANGVIVFDGLCNKMKLSNSATLLLYLLPKCLFTLSKLRYFKLRRPKISSCYKLLKKKEGAHKLVDTLLYLLEVVVYTTKHQDWIFMYSLRKTL